MGIFTGRLTDLGFEPPLIHRLLAPRISGNTINGLDEADVRRPSRIYHWCYLTRTVWYPHYFVNMLLVIKAKLFHRPFARIVNAALAEQQRDLRPVAAVRTERPAEEWAGRIKQFAQRSGADLVGIVQADPVWVTDGCGELPARWLIMLGFRMKYEGMEFEGEHNASVKQGVALETVRVYHRGQRTVNTLVEWIREQGWSASGCCGPGVSGVSMIPPALAAGFGELGKHGSIINREFGSALRLGYVAVDIPLVSDQPDTFGGDDFCTRCKVCADACPPGAIVDEKQLVRGVHKWYVDFDKCMPYFNEELGCGICITVCPWSRPGVATRLAEKLRRRSDRKRV